MGQRKLDLEPIDDEESAGSKKLDLEPVDEPVDLSIPEHLKVQPYKPESIKPQKSTLRGVWDTISEPLTDAPSRFARSVANYVDAPSADPSNPLTNFTAQLRGGVAGGITGIGDLISGLSSPINLATALFSGGQAPAIKAGLPQVAKLLRAGEIGAGALMAGHGGSEVIRPDATMMERGMGLAELAGGSAAALHSPVGKPKPRVNPILDEDAQSLANVEQWQAAKDALDDLQFKTGKPLNQGEVMPVHGPLPEPAIIPEPAINEIAARSRGNRINASLPDEQPFGEQIDFTPTKPRINAAQAAQNLREGGSLTSPPIVEPQQPLDWKTDPMKNRGLRQEYQSHVAESKLEGRDPLSIQDFLAERNSGVANDLMDDFNASQRKGPVPEGEPYIGENGEIIGRTTDNEGSTGFAPVNEELAIRPKVHIPELTNEGAPPLPKIYDETNPNINFIKDSDRMEAARISRENDPRLWAERDIRAAKENEIQTGMRSNDLYEGRFGKPNERPPSRESLTPEQRAVQDSWAALQKQSDEYGSWFSEQEELLPEGEFFKPPSEVRAKYDTERAGLTEAHEANVARNEQFANQVIPDESVSFKPRRIDPNIIDVEPLPRNEMESRPNEMATELGGESLKKDIAEDRPSKPATPDKDSIILPSGSQTNQAINELRSKGYRYAGQDKNGDAVYKKSVDPIPVSTNAVPIIRKIKDIEPAKAGPIREAWNLSRSLVSVDLPFITSAAFRQTLPSIGTGPWLKAWGPSIRSYGSKAFYEAHTALIKADPLLQRGTRPVMTSAGTPLIKQGRPVLKEMPSILENAGVVLSDLKSGLTGREEAIRSQFAETIPVYGKVIAANNRAFSAFINDVRVNSFRNLYDAMPNKNDMVALKQLGDAVGTFTGRGRLATQIPFTTDPKTGGRRVASLEKYAGAMAEVLFAPRLMARQLQMLNPVNYTMLQPQARNAYVKALARTAGAWVTMAQLGKMAGGEVSLNPTSADFGKIKIGKLRLDPPAGLQQFIVLGARSATNKFTSSTSGRTFELGKGFGSQSRGDVAQSFLSNKLQPNVKYMYDAMFASERKPFSMVDRAIQMAVPMMVGDMVEIAKEEPELLPWLAPLVSSGVGSQYYGPGEKMGRSRILAPALRAMGVKKPERFDVTLGQ